MLKNTNYYRISDTKLTDWLRHKVDNISNHFKNNPSEALGLIRAQASGYRAKKNETVENVQLIQIAVGIISEYLPPNFTKLLKSSYGSELNSTLVLKNPKNSLEGELYDDARYGKVVEKRKASSPITESPNQEKKRKVKAHEKIDTRKITPLTSFFSTKK